MGMDASFRINVNNLLDTEYIAESNSNIHAEDGSDTWNGVDTRNFVWFGFGHMERNFEVQLLRFAQQFGNGRLRSPVFLCRIFRA